MKVNITKSLIYFILFYSFNTLFFVLLKEKVSAIFGITKEVILVLMAISVFIINSSFVSKRILILTIGLLVIIFSSLLLSVGNGMELFNYIYQFKVDAFYVFVFIVLCSYFKSYGSEELIKGILRLFVFFGIVNSIMAIYQRLYFFDFLKIIGVEGVSADYIPALGKVDGLVLQTQGGLFRSIGTMSTPMACAEFSLISLFIYLYRYYNHSVKHVLYVAMFLFSIYVTGYKTVYLTTIAVLFAFSSKKYSAASYRISALIIILFGFLSVNTLYIYNIFKDISPIYAEYSIKLRYDYVADIFSALSNNITNVTGGMFAFNGNYLEIIPGAVPLDSMYIYYLSNYGFIGLLLLFFMCMFLYIKSKNINIYVSGKNIPVGLFFFLFFSSNLFFNQPFINFPSGFHALFLFIIAINQKKDDRQKYI